MSDYYGGGYSYVIDGPISVEDVVAWTPGMSMPEGDELALLERVLAAVLEGVALECTLPDEGSPSIDQAIIMQTARLWRRRDSVDGVAAFNNDFGPIRVNRFDSDVQALLAPYMAWGFA